MALQPERVRVAMRSHRGLRCGNAVRKQGGANGAVPWSRSG